MDPAKVEAVMWWPRLTAMIEVRGLLCLASYYKRFVQDFPKISKVMTQSTKKGKPLVWTLACEESFQDLNRRLVTA